MDSSVYLKKLEELEIENNNLKEELAKSNKKLAELSMIVTALEKSYGMDSIKAALAGYTVKNQNKSK